MVLRRGRRRRRRRRIGSVVECRGRRRRILVACAGGQRHEADHQRQQHVAAHTLVLRENRGTCDGKIVAVREFRRSWGDSYRLRSSSLSRYSFVAFLLVSGGPSVGEGVYSGHMYSSISSSTILSCCFALSSALRKIGQTNRKAELPTRWEGGRSRLVIVLASSSSPSWSPDRARLNLQCAVQSKTRGSRVRLSAVP
jgi:hypothetical protein